MTWAVDDERGIFAGAVFRPATPNQRRILERIGKQALRAHHLHKHPDAHHGFRGLCHYVHVRTH